MNSISKIHFNSSTGVSLNDRFTIMSKVSPSDNVKLTSNLNGGLRLKRSNSVDSLPRRGSLVNKQLLHQLDRRHLGQNTPFRVRNRNIRSGRQRLNRTSFSSRTNLRRIAGNTLSLVGGSRRLQRSNSLTDVATMNADYFERLSLNRSSSQQNISSRLGGSSRTPRSRSRGSRSRPPQRTSSSSNLGGRSRSRGGPRDGSNHRSRSRPRMSRSRSRLPPASRNRSRSNGMNGGGNFDHRLGRGRPRGRSSVRRGRGNGNYSRANSRSTGRTGSVNGRLGSNRTSWPISNGYRGGRGWIGKRGMRRGGGTFGQNGWTGGMPGRMPGRNPQRGGRGGANGAPPYRGRSRSRGRAASQNRARSGQRGRNASQGRRASAPTKSKEDLDKELDQYMANTKSSLDKEMDEYMNGIHSNIL
ncbi:serine/arginine repetitive matrix protein 2-like isoform X2 [Wyeomyia smithii]|uniref:serine/arginine repetitive matrix protein 2-like isoform X2 n=1 Tax=Wyeomyia smithii TaxID=174621 RepID=UPI002467F4AA|nr:serine/arginine repetitive matrix protein 2-like isoform X2 [Wyeomyia smithii]